LYLLLALRFGLEGIVVADTLVSLASWTVAASIVAHGLAAQPLVRRYLGWRQGMRAQRAIEGRRP
jgi:NhaP-type Na+/H+ or K+/H+ antiporter